MSLPGPSGAELVLELLAFGLVVALLGEGVRRLLARWVRFWRDLELVERGLVDLFLGGAVVYLVAALPVGAFYAATLAGLIVLAAAWLVVVAARRPAGSWSLRSLFGPLVRPAALGAEAAALLLLVFEVAVAAPVGTGNTYDASLLTYYTAGLLQGHDLVLSFLPSAPVGLLYPQGTTAWLGAAELLLGLPGARASLLLTPLFFALAPLGGFVLGRRLFAGDRGGFAVAAMLAGIASWTRVLVAGSNDFVFAFPLVLVLAAQALDWTRRTPSTGDALGFGLLLGYSAALNPVGAEWLSVSLLLLGAFALPRWGGSARRWLARWASAIAAALLPLLPTWYVVARGLTAPGYVPGPGPPAPDALGLGLAQFIGYVDPYLFGPSDVWFSPLPVLRAELVLLFTVGLAVLLLVPRAALRDAFSPTRAFLVAAGLPMFVLLGLDWAGSGGGPLADLASVVSEPEMSIWLLTVYAIIATVPLWWLLERAAQAAPSPGPSAPSRPVAARPRATGRRSATAFVLPVALAAALLVPGVALTPTQLPSTLSGLYSDFGNVSAADFALLEYAGSHFPAGARVLVAPGSAAEFLPAYDPTAVLLYPMLPGWTRLNASYTLVVSELTNGTLDADGFTALTTLGVRYVLVTPENSILWPAFSPEPFLRSPFFSLVFADGKDLAFALPTRGTYP